MAEAWAHAARKANKPALAVRASAIALAQYPNDVHATEVRVQFAASSGASGTRDFWADLARYDGTGGAYSAYSGAGPAATLQRISNLLHRARTLTSAILYTWEL